MEVEQLSFIPMPKPKVKKTKPKDSKVQEIKPVEIKPIEKGSRVKVICFERDNTGMVIKLSLTGDWAYTVYYYKDDPRKRLNYAYFNVSDELRAV